MNEPIKITDLKTLREAKIILRLKADYHRMGVELELRKKLSGGELWGGVVNALTGTGGKESRSKAAKASYAPLIGTLVSVGVSIAIAKIRSGRSWGEVIKHVISRLFNKFAASAISNAAANK